MKRKKALYLVLFLVACTSGNTKDEPRTLYKAEDITRARENIERYQWARDIVDGWKRNVDYAMQQDRAFFDNMISELTMWPTYGQNCPHCVGKQSSMGETGIYTWDIRDPDRLECKHCGTVYPNPDYPETGSITAPRMGQTFAFYETDEERAHPDDTTGKYALRWASWPVHTSFSGVVRSNKANWCYRNILPLAKLYAVTGEVKYAEHAAWIMDIMAKRYPTWMFHSYNGTYADCPPGEAASSLGEYPRAGKFPIETIITAFEGLHTKGDYAVLNNGFWGAGRFGCSGSDGGIILNITVAYDLIRSARFPDGRPVLTPEMDKRIVDDLIIAGCDDSENWKEINNKCGPGRALSGAVGILFERPLSVRRAIEGFELLMDHSFHFDGFCKETPSYSAMHLNLMRNIPEILMGYSDPENFVPKDNKLLRDFNPFTGIDRYRLALESMVRMLDPSNRYPVIGDTHYGGGSSTIYAEILTDRYSQTYAPLLEKAQGAALADKGSEYALWHRAPDLKAVSGGTLPHYTEWFPGWHVGVLRAGSADSHTTLYMNANESGVHRHYDILSISYIAHGVEAATDRGYIWDDPRNAWTKGTLSHNLVVVDGTTQNSKNRTSKLELFGASPGVEVIRVSAQAYEQCDLYERTTALVTVSGEQTYVVDFFRVDGGKKHQYSFNSSGSLISVTGKKPRAIAEKIKWLDNLRVSKPKAPFTATWENEGVRTDLTMLNDIDRLIVADAPGWRSDRGDELNAPPIQQILAERTNEDRAVSQYAAVIVPYKGEDSPVKSARLVVNDYESGIMGVAVELDDRTDFILSSPVEGPHTYGPVSMDGQFGFVSLNSGGKMTQGYLLEGTELRYERFEINVERSHIPLKVVSVEGMTINLREPVPAGMTLRGKYILVGDTGYEIESAAGKIITVRDYPVVECDEVTVLNSKWYEK